MGARNKLTNDQIREIVKIRKETGVKYSYLAKKYGVSTDLIFIFCKYDKEGKLDEYLERRIKNQVKLLDGLPKLRKYECEYSPFKTKPQINKFYAETLKIGDNINLSSNAARREINRLMGFLNLDTFKKEYGRDFNIVDLYLTTNLSIKGLCETYQGYMTVIEAKQILNFLHRQLMRVDNLNLFYTYMYSASTTYYRFTRPSEKRIIQILNQQFFSSNKIDATKEEIEKAYQILLDLNEKYGVKYDEVSFYAIIDVVKAGLEDTFYQIGDKYKDKLDQRTEVRVRCIPTLTRRENKDKKKVS